jgi:23S rRNA (cytosine1962-C5)-methyltransferase
MAGHRAGRPPPVRAPAGAAIVDGHSEEWLRKGFPWVYDEEIVAIDEALQAGAEVAIRARNSASLGTGIVADDGKVRIRRFRTDEGPIDAAFLAERVAEAVARRRIDEETDAYRIVHGENDGLPGIRIDRWADVLSVVLDSPSLERVALPLLDALAHASASLVARGKGNTPKWVRGERRPEVVVRERGLRFLVRPEDGQDAGLYCDLRDVRAWMAPHWAGRRVLNTFGHTGAFTVAALAAGASEVVHVDLSPTYCAWAEKNLALNGLAGAVFVVDDALKALDRLRRTGERFGVVVLDPPAFSTSESGAFAVERDYGVLAANAVRVLEPGGWLIAVVHQGAIGPRQFQQFLLDAEHRTGRSLRILHQGSPPIDFPAALSFPESRYLKVSILEIGR